MVNVNHSVDIEDSENEFNENASSTDVEHDVCDFIINQLSIHNSTGYIYKYLF
jgi:hypothetical protein